MDAGLAGPSALLAREGGPGPSMARAPAFATSAWPGSKAVFRIRAAADGGFIGLGAAVTAYDRDGAKRWEQPLNELDRPEIADGAAAADGSVVIVADHQVARVTADGRIEAIVTLGVEREDVSATAVVLDEDGAPVVAGSYYQLCHGPCVEANRDLADLRLTQDLFVLDLEL
jgi:hypothetical protein